MGKVCLFVSGKGGAGKTTVCVNLAVALALRGKHVLVIDGDISASKCRYSFGASKSGGAGRRRRLFGRLLL